MKRRPRKKKEACGAGEDAPPRVSEEPARTGLPARDSVVGETTFKSPKGQVYRILKTNETDAYDKPAPAKGRRRSGR